MKTASNRLSVVLIVLIGLLGKTAAADDATNQNLIVTPAYSVGLNTVGYWQALNHSNSDGSLKNLVTGFQSAAGNLNFRANIADGIDLYFEIYLSSRHHEGQVSPREGYLMITAAPSGINFMPVRKIFEVIDVKAGHFEINYGNRHLRRSDNAQVQSNPLIGNDIVDPNVVYVGTEISTKPGRFNALLGITNGQTTGDFQEGHQYAFHGKLWGEVTSFLSVAGSYYRADQSNNPIGYPVGGSFSNLFAGNRSGGRYADVLGGGGEPGQIRPGNGQDVTAWQGDVALELGQLTVQGHYGNILDADINGTNPADETTFGKVGESWDYYSIQAVYGMGSPIHAAIRYTGTTAKELNGAPATGKVERVQVGIGLWIARGMLLKVEYVNQAYTDFDADMKVDRMAVGLSPKFSGLISEISISF